MPSPPEKSLPSSRDEGDEGDAGSGHSLASGRDVAFNVMLASMLWALEQVLDTESSSHECRSLLRDHDCRLRVLGHRIVSDDREVSHHSPKLASAGSPRMVCRCKEAEREKIRRSIRSASSNVTDKQSVRALAAIYGKPLLTGDDVASDPTKSQVPALLSPLSRTEEIKAPVLFNTQHSSGTPQFKESLVAQKNRMSCTLAMLEAQCEPLEKDHDRDSKDDKPTREITQTSVVTDHTPPSKISQHYAIVSCLGEGLKANANNSLRTIRKISLGRLCVGLAHLYGVMGTPYVVCFGVDDAFWSFCEVSCELLLIIGFVFPVLKAMRRTDEKHPGLSLRSSWAAYMRLPHAYLNLLIAIPWHLFWLFSARQTTILLRLALLRLVNLPRVIMFLVVSDPRTSIGASIHPNLLRVLRLFFAYFVISHLAACTYSFWVITHEESDWGIYAGDYRGTFHQYINAMYWSMAVINAGGPGPAPEVMGETSITGFVVGMGVFMNSCIAGSMTALLGQMDEEAADRKSKTDSIRTFLRKNAVTRDLCHEVNEYYNYFYESQSSRSGKMFLHLSKSLRKKLDFCLYSKFVSACSLFTQCPQDLTMKIITIITSNSMISIPFEVIFHQGDVADGMYFLARGEIMLHVCTQGRYLSKEDVEALSKLKPQESRHGSVVVAKLRSGAFFGELALIKDAGRGATATSTVFSELLFLPKSDFEETLVEWPEFAQQLVENLKNRSSTVRLPSHQTSGDRVDDAKTTIVGNKH